MVRKKYLIGFGQDAIEAFVPWIKENIEESSDKKIRIRTKDIAKAMGKNFEKKKDKDIYWGLKYTLFLDGIVIDKGRTLAGEHLLIMRMADKEDRLPAPCVEE